MFAASKRAGCDVRQLECQASSVTASVQKVTQTCHSPDRGLWTIHRRTINRTDCSVGGQFTGRLFTGRC